MPTFALRPNLGPPKRPGDEPGVHEGFMRDHKALLPSLARARFGQKVSFSLMSANAWRKSGFQFLLLLFPPMSLIYPLASLESSGN